MANIKSKQKRILIAGREKARNASKKSAVKTAIKKFELAAAENDKAKAEELYPATVSLIDRARSDGVFHINTASRKKARLYRLLAAIK